MPRLLKYIERGLPFFVTSRTEEGLLFPANKNFKDLFFSILARGQYHYPVDIVAFCLMANHFHMILVPKNPEDLPLFVGYVKQEMAHAVNHILGREKHTVWCSGYDSPVLLGEEEVLDYLCYIYTQPQNADLVESIDQYPGASSWTMFIGNLDSISMPVSSRSDPFNFNNSKKYDLVMDPFAWTKGLLVDSSNSSLKKRLIKLVRDKEAELALTRRKKGVTPLGSKRLSMRPMDLSYKPLKFGRRMLCICREISFRKAFIKFYKELVENAKEVLSSWRKNDFSIPWPPGLFPPSFPKFNSPRKGYAIRESSSLVF